MVNYETFDDDKITYLSESKSLFDNENVDVRLSDIYRESVSVQTRNKIRAFALKDSKMGITKDDLRHEQRLDPHFRVLIVYLQQRLLPTNRQK